jgi:parallel beta-helix repeat protein
VEVLGRDNVIGAPGDEKNYISGNIGPGVLLQGPKATGNEVVGNVIGLPLSDEGARRPNRHGVVIDGAPNNRIGGTGDLEGNVISGNGFGFLDESSGVGVKIVGSEAVGNRVVGNRIGPLAEGPNGAANQLAGIVLEDASETRISNNIVSGNGPVEAQVTSEYKGAGIFIGGDDAHGNTLTGNFVGVTPAGTGALPNTGYGILIDRSGRNTIGGQKAGKGNLISGNGDSGIRIDGPDADYNEIYGNTIGLDGNGAGVVPNGGNGIEVSGAEWTTIGGPSTAETNVVSGNFFNGIELIDSDWTHVYGNYIGTDRTVQFGKGNGTSGVVVSGGKHNSIGGFDDNTGNFISGNSSSGIDISDAVDTDVLQNYVGTDATGAAPIPNQMGISITASTRTSIGAVTGLGNLISGNVEHGINILGGNDGTRVWGNRIGAAFDTLDDLGNGGAGIAVQGSINTDIAFVDGPNRIHNNAVGIEVIEGEAEIRYNSISDNDGLGIDLGAPGPLENDPGDVDQGPNRLQNFPEIEQATDAGHLDGTLVGTAGATVTVDVYSSDSCDPSGYGEGFERVASRKLSVGTDGVTDLSLSVKGLDPGAFVTATATSAKQTSEFSPCVVVLDVDQRWLR